MEVSLEERRLLGHHLNPNARGPVTYGRDEAARLMSKVDSVVEKIRSGRFRPNASRAWRLAHLVEAGRPDPGLDEGPADVRQESEPSQGEDDG